MKDKNGNITIRSVWSWLRSDKGKKYSFFIFYIFFFIFVFVILSFKNEDTRPNETEKLSLPYSIQSFENDTSKFMYTINYNDNISEYLIVREGDNVTLSDDRGVYHYRYQDGNLVFLDEIEPSFYSNFMNIYELKRMIKGATLDSETKFSSTGEYVYKYQILNSTLCNLLNTNLITSDLNNEITIQTDASKETKMITLNLTNYFKNVLSEDVNLYEITLTYGDTYE